MSSSSFVCASCGKEHPGLPTDWGFKRPDEVHQLSYLDEYTRCRLNADLCTLDESRYFFRGLVTVPLLDAADEFAWGIWVEVGREVHDAYLHGFDSDMSSHEPLSGVLANRIPGYSETIGLPVTIHLQDETTRPQFRFAATLEHALAHEQRRGMSVKRHHDILTGLGFFKDVDASPEG